jgi:hypothetical protein
LCHSVYCAKYRFLDLLCVSHLDDLNESDVGIGLNKGKLWPRIDPNLFFQIFVSCPPKRNGGRAAHPTSRSNFDPGHWPNFAKPLFFDGSDPIGVTDLENKGIFENEGQG